MANWWRSFDTRGWSNCDSSDEFITGFYRNDVNGKDDKIYLLEEANCCKAAAQNHNTKSTCIEADWWYQLDSFHIWAVCPEGHFLQGLYRTWGDWLYNIEEGKCCKPKHLPNKYGQCIIKDIGASFHKKGLTGCDHGYYMAGFYKGGCEELHCIDKVKCCQMFESPPEPSQECSNYEVIDDSTRSRGYQTSSSKCDDTMETKWYRFQGASGDAMPLSCVPKNRCGTRAPGWLHETHPTVAHGIVSAKVCYHWGDNCCHWSNTIRVRNCDGFFVYELNKSPGCNLRYCGNSGPGLTLPPECINYEYLGDDTRARGYGNVQSFKCDNKLKTKWYRLRGSSGNELPSSCVPMNSCGTHAPGWLQGHHPTVAQGIAAVKACFHWKKGCCQWQTDIRVRNCDGFYVYELKPSPACHLRYCGSSVRNQCKNNPCKNGATCFNLQDSYRCECKLGFSGVNCEKDTDECANKPCQNEGSCVNLQGGYRCDCKSGYTGKNCEDDVNECTNNPCKNGVACINLRGSYRCDCKSGYTGRNCETDINECTKSPCKNGATCVNLQGSYRCDCVTGYSGKTCETDINECEANPCKNGGTCVDLVGDYRCDCVPGYTGTDCETAPKLTTSSPPITTQPPVIGANACKE
nr:fibrillin-3-like [Pocillopora verrucosa]